MQLKFKIKGSGLHKTEVKNTKLGAEFIPVKRKVIIRLEIVH